MFTGEFIANWFWASRLLFRKQFLKKRMNFISNIGESDLIYFKFIQMRLFQNSNGRF